MEPPVPIPNTEVKLRSADDTAPARVWENRSLPGDYFFKKPIEKWAFYIMGFKVFGRLCWLKCIIDRLSSCKIGFTQHRTLTNFRIKHENCV